MEKAKKLKASQAKKIRIRGQFKVCNFYRIRQKGEKTDGKIKVEMNEEKIENDKKLAGYNMIVTSEINMADSEIYAAYHNLWRIEESFKIMKSQLDARPVFYKKKTRLSGIFNLLSVCFTGKITAD